MDLTNKLALRPTQWKWWYAILGMVAMVLSSQMGVIVQVFGSSESSLTRFIIDLVPPLQFIAFSALALWVVRLFSRRWPTVEDLGLKKSISFKELLLLIVVFVVTHMIFWLLSWGEENSGQAAQYFGELGFDRGIVSAFFIMLSSVLLAPLCEELLYRGVIHRSLQDHFARWMPLSTATLIAALLSAAFFALPHLGDALLSKVTVAYMVTGLAFAFVYIVTGSLTAAMVSHSLQSCYAFSQIIIFGHGQTSVPLFIYLLVFGCPLWTFLCARALYAILPKSNQVL